MQLAKSFVDQHVAAFFGLDVGGHEEEQEAFARQMLLWVRPLLVNQPWRAETSGLAGVTGEDVTPQAAYISLRGAMINLSHPELPSKRLVFVGVIHTQTVSQKNKSTCITIARAVSWGSLRREKKDLLAYAPL